MKRFLMLAGTLFVCSTLVGCSAESHIGLISETINLIEVAVTDVGSISKQVNEAVKKSVDEGKKLDLTEAVKAAEQLKKTGEKTQEIKRRIEQVRSSVTDEERKTNAIEKRDALNDVVKRLLEKKEQLRKALDAADKINKVEVDSLRKKIVDAESPFEAITRQ